MHSETPPRRARGGPGKGNKPPPPGTAEKTKLSVQDERCCVREGPLARMHAPELELIWWVQEPLPLQLLPPAEGRGNSKGGGEEEVKGATLGAVLDPDAHPPVEPNDYPPAKPEAAGTSNNQAQAFLNTLSSSSAMLASSLFGVQQTVAVDGAEEGEAERPPVRLNKQKRRPLTLLRPGDLLRTIWLPGAPLPSTASSIPFSSILRACMEGGTPLKPLILTFGPPAHPWETSSSSKQSSQQRQNPFSSIAPSSSPKSNTPLKQHTSPSSNRKQPPVQAKTKAALAEADQWFKDTSNTLSQWLTAPVPTSGQHEQQRHSREKILSGSKAQRAKMNREARQNSPSQQQGKTTSSSSSTMPRARRRSQELLSLSDRDRSLSRTLIRWTNTALRGELLCMDVPNLDRERATFEPVRLIEEDFRSGVVVYRLLEILSASTQDSCPALNTFGRLVIPNRVTVGAKTTASAGGGTPSVDGMSTLTAVETRPSRLQSLSNYYTVNRYLKRRLAVSHGQRSKQEDDDDCCEAEVIDAELMNQVVEGDVHATVQLLYFVFLLFAHHRILRLQTLRDLKHQSTEATPAASSPTSPPLPGVATHAYIDWQEKRLAKYLEVWLRARLAKFQHIHVDRMRQNHRYEHSAYLDGRAFLALLSSISPRQCPYTPLPEPGKNFSASMAAAEAILGAPSLWGARDSSRIIKDAYECLILYLTEVRLSVLSHPDFAGGDSLAIGVGVAEVTPEDEAVPAPSEQSAVVNAAVTSLDEDEAPTVAEEASKQSLLEAHERSGKNIQVVVTVHSADGLCLPVNPFAAVRVGTRGKWATTEVIASNPCPIFEHTSVHYPFIRNSKPKPQQPVHQTEGPVREQPTRNVLEENRHHNELDSRGADLKGIDNIELNSDPRTAKKDKSTSKPDAPGASKKPEDTDASFDESDISVPNVDTEPGMPEKAEGTAEDADASSDESDEPGVSEKPEGTAEDVDASSDEDADTEPGMPEKPESTAEDVDASSDEDADTEPGMPEKVEGTAEDVDASFDEDADTEPGMPEKVEGTAEDVDASSDEDADTEPGMPEKAEGTAEDADALSEKDDDAEAPVDESENNASVSPDGSEKCGSESESGDGDDISLSSDDDDATQHDEDVQTTEAHSDTQDTPHTTVTVPLFLRLLSVNEKGDDVIIGQITDPLSVEFKQDLSGLLTPVQVLREFACLAVSSPGRSQSEGLCVSSTSLARVYVSVNVVQPSEISRWLYVLHTQHQEDRKSTSEAMNKVAAVHTENEDLRVKILELQSELRRAKAS